MSEVVLRLSPDAALVLLALVARVNEDGLVEFEDQAEQRVLWDLECDLEGAVTGVLASNFQSLLQDARRRVRDVE
jgi:hypothetical protein